MSRFFFDFDDSGALSQDNEGQDFLDTEAMRIEALKTLSRVAMDGMPNGNRRAVIVDVRDEDGTVIFTASLILMARWMKDRPARELGIG